MNTCCTQTAFPFNLQYRSILPFCSFGEEATQNTERQADLHEVSRSHEAPVGHPKGHFAFWRERLALVADVSTEWSGITGFAGYASPVKFGVYKEMPEGHGIIGRKWVCFLILWGTHKWFTWCPFALRWFSSQAKPEGKHEVFKLQRHTWRCGSKFS